MDIQIKQIKEYSKILDLSKHFDMAIHPMDNIETGWHAILNGKVIGGVVLRKSGKYYQLDLLTVLEEYQKQGIGSKLLNALLDYLKKKNIHILYIITRHAKDFYLKHNFVEVKELPKECCMCLTCPKKGQCTPAFMKLDF